MLPRGESTGGGVVALTATDLLNPEINRPDFYTERYEIRSGIKRYLTKENQILISIAIIILSAFIFILIVAWASCLQTYIESKMVNPLIEKEYQAKLLYSTIITIICFFVFLIFGLFYTIAKRRKV